MPVRSHGGTGKTFFKILLSEIATTYTVSFSQDICRRVDTAFQLQENSTFGTTFKDDKWVELADKTLSSARSSHAIFKVPDYLIAQCTTVKMGRVGGEIPFRKFDSGNRENEPCHDFVFSDQRRVRHVAGLGRVFRHLRYGNAIPQPRLRLSRSRERWRGLSGSRNGHGGVSDQRMPDCTSIRRARIPPA